MKFLTVFFLFLFLFDLSMAQCEEDGVAVYKVKLNTFWSEELFPKDYPNLFRPKAQWSQTFGQSHNTSYALFRFNEVARPSVINFAQFGKVDLLIEEGEEESKVYDQFAADPINRGVGSTEALVFVDGAHSLVSLISRMVPSPDWFVGVDSLNLCVDSSWVEEITLDLDPLDAGAASGLTFTAPRWETKPPAPVSKHGPRNPNHPAAGFYYPELKHLPSIAKVEFTKLKEYTSKDLTKLAREELYDSGDKNRRKGLPKHPFTERPWTEELTTKSYEDHLKDLEEEPVGTASPNFNHDYVEVVTRATTTTTTTVEPEFGKHLHNMDDVVMAVAHGHRMGLQGNHLPRHFRSRLHHAINVIQPNDCLVSEWSDWTPCSVTCGFGDKFRTRTVIREKQEGGRDCPELVYREHCGNVNSCAHVDYFDW